METAKRRPSPERFGPPTAATMPHVMNRDFVTSLLKKGIAPRWPDQAIPDGREWQRIRTTVQFYRRYIGPRRLRRGVPRRRRASNHTPR